jgi:hypothetical protein
MFHKNSKAISSYKFQINKTKVTYPSIFQNSVLYNVDLNSLFQYYYYSRVIEGLITLLSKKSKKLFRSQYKNKKRKYLFLFSSFNKLLLRKKKKIIFFLFGLKLKKKRRKKKIMFFKKKRKYRFKILRIRRKKNILYNSQIGKIILYMLLYQKFIAFIPTSLLYRKGYLKKVLVLKKKK